MSVREVCNDLQPVTPRNPFNVPGHLLFSWYILGRFEMLVPLTPGAIIVSN